MTQGARGFEQPTAEWSGEPAPADLGAPAPADLREGLLPQLAEEGVEAADYVEDRLRAVAQDRPLVLLAGAALLGFAAGVLVGAARARRHGAEEEDD